MNPTSHRPGNRRFWSGLVLMIGLACSLTSGCALPPFMKIAQPREKPSQEHFSCGDKCPPSLRETTLH